MILEGIVTTISAQGAVNIAPMGPHVESDLTHFLLRPFNTAQTYRNLKEHGEGVFHVTDDVLLLAQAALGLIDPQPTLFPAEHVRGLVLQNACRYYEFQVRSIDDRDERVNIDVAIVHAGRLRDFFGFNRAKHAVVEAAILATRTDFLPLDDIEADYRKLAVIVAKTGGEQEKQAFAFLQAQVDQVALAKREGAQAMIRVETPSRLHFGLLSMTTGNLWPDLHGQETLFARRFGGIGLMIQKPGVCLSVQAGPDWSAEGPLAERALSYARRLIQSVPAEAIRPQRIIIEASAPEHAGLGTGTQLGMAVAQALAITFGLLELSPMELALLVGRGKRSALGIHGFAHGGFLVEAGKRHSDRIAPLVARVDFPDAWRIVLVLPPDEPGLYGLEENQAFQRLNRSGTALALTESLCRLVLLNLLPALLEQDLATFGEALYDFNLRVGEVFAPIQGGPYASPRLLDIVAFIRHQGIRGTGQSSWGPAVFAVVADEDRAHDLARRLRDRFALAADHVIVTAANNEGAHLIQTTAEG